MVCNTPASAQTTNWDKIRSEFRSPPVDYRPHTRWWWPLAVTKEEITRELEEMHAHGIGGVEQITMGQYYEKGAVPFMSDAFIDLLKHMVHEAKRLGMEVSINFGGPGWIIGGEWVPENERSKDIVPTSMLVEGPKMVHMKLPVALTKTQRSWEKFTPKLSGKEKLLAVVAGEILDGRLDETSLVDLTARVNSDTLQWRAPDGQWQIMAFWLKNNHGEAVDHFSDKAMQRYCHDFGGKLYETFGDEFGKTVESMFVDSFELPNSASGIYWSENLLEKFQAFKGYDLTKYLPAIWWQIDNISPKIRYDVNEFRHHQGLAAFYKTFLSWCEKHGVKGRIQPYGFTTDNIAAAGMTHMPEMEITAGEKDQHPWFDTRIGPKKYVASGAHIYGKKVISAEAYTFIHWERFRATLEELKIASDGYLRSGATKFYNHGYSYSSESDIAPSRTIGFAALLNHQNIWWKYYPVLADYVTRCSYILRQGDFAPDIAIYSPLANQWTKDVLNARKWTREFDWGDLGDLLLANGYDFDLLNDDALQNHAQIVSNEIAIRAMRYKVLLLPNLESLPLSTLKFIEKYVREGGNVIALDRLPAFSTGLQNYQQNDAAVQNIVQQLFDERGKKKVGKGKTWFIKNVIHRPIWWDKYASIFDPFLNTLRAIVPPDFAIDFAQQNMRKNKGLAFYHRKLESSDIYFVANIQDCVADMPVTFRTSKQHIEQWNPFTGEIENIHQFKAAETGIELPLQLQPYASTLFVFHPVETEMHVIHSDFQSIKNRTKNRITAFAAQNGVHQISVIKKGNTTTTSIHVEDIPA
ncbi:MAG: hypothetical protein DWQ10_10270, partial [Calditrichaeota bacterium]